MTGKVRIIAKRFHQQCVAMILGAVVLAGCVGLPAPDGVEATLIKRAEGLPELTSAGTASVVEVARAGLLFNPVVRDAAAQVAASADEVRVQRGALLPSLGVSFGGGVGNAGSGAGVVTLTGEQLLTDFGQSDRAITSADIELQIDHLEFQKTVDEALIDVLSAYDEVNSLVLLVDLREEQVAAMSELETLVESRIELGAVPATDLLETRKRVHLAEFELQDARLALDEARDRLARLSGQGQGGEVPVLTSSCVAERPARDIQISQLQLAKAEVDLQSSEAARRPGVAVSPIVRSEIGAGELGAGLNLRINSDLLEGGALTARADAARNELAKAAAALDAAMLEDALELRRLRREIDAASQRLELLNRQISLLREAGMLYRDQYFDLGTRQLSELLDSEAEYYERQVERVEVRSGLTEVRLECAARGGTLRGTFGVENQRLYGLPLDWT